MRDIRFRFGNICIASQRRASKTQSGRSIYKQKDKQILSAFAPSSCLLACSLACSSLLLRPRSRPAAKSRRASSARRANVTLLARANLSSWPPPPPPPVCPSISRLILAFLQFRLCKAPLEAAKAVKLRPTTVGGGAFARVARPQANLCGPDVRACSPFKGTFFPSRSLLWPQVFCSCFPAYKASKQKRER